MFALPGIDAVNFINEAAESGLLDSVTIAFFGFSETYLGLLGPDLSEGILYETPPDC